MVHNSGSDHQRPVMLVFADLTQNPKPRECKAYYLWIDEIIHELSKGQDDLNHLGKKSHTFRIPVKNELNEELNVLPYLDKRYKELRALKGFYDNVAKNTQEPVQAIDKIGTRLSNKVHLESVLEDTDNPWIDAPQDSFPGGLHTISDMLKNNNAQLAKVELDKLSKRLNEANKHEKADYFYQLGRLNSLIGKYDISLKNHKEANKLCPDKKKYRCRYLEMKLNKNFDNSKIIKQVISETEKDSDIEYVRLKAKALALLRDKRALSLLEDKAEKDVIVIKCLVLLLLRDYKSCVDISNHALRKLSLKPRQRLSILLFKIRALFQLGFGNDDPQKYAIIPFAGLPSMDDKILKECWKDVITSWEIGASLGHPDDLVYTIDISSILGMYFNEVEEIYEKIKHFARIRPHLIEAQETLLRLALQAQDYKTAQEQFSLIPERPEIIVFKILFEYDQKHRKDVVRITLENIKKLFKGNLNLLDTVLLCAAECANELALRKEEGLILKKIKSLPNGNDILATYEFYKTVSKNLLDKDKAITGLYETFKNGSTHPQVLFQLLTYLDSTTEDGAKKICEVSESIQKTRKLLFSEVLIVAQALATLKDWENLFALVESSLERFEDRPILIAIKVMALDSLGNTPGALKLLEKSTEENFQDASALEIYINIYARCGFAEKAQSLIERLLEKTDDSKKQLHLFRMLFLSEMNIDYKSPKLLDYCEKYGELNDKDNEEEEGIYLQLSFAATSFKENKPTQQQQKVFQERLKAYTKRFPDSKYLRAVTHSKDAPPGEIVEQLQNAIGLTEDIIKKYQQNEELLKSGQMIVPFPIKPSYLNNVCDLLHLWQISKISSPHEKQYHLALENGKYEYKPQQTILEKLPLIDEVSLLVLNDLELLEKLFDVFPKVAIAKSTIMRLQNWGQHFISGFSPIAKSITQSLKNNIKNIYQISGADVNLDFMSPDIGEYKEIINDRDQLILYSDDVTIRFIVYEDQYKQDGMTTVDLIEILRTKGIITELEASGKIALLCKWNVNGIPVKYIDILRVISLDFTGRESLDESIAKLKEHEDFNNMIEYIWGYDKQYEDCLKDIVSFISIIMSNEEIEVEENIIGAIWLTWYYKVSIKYTGERDKLGYLAKSFYLICFYIVANNIDTEKYLHISSKLWSLYQTLVEKIYHNQMTDEIFKKSIKNVAELVAKGENRNKLYKLINAGISIKSPDGQIFSQHYTASGVKYQSGR